MKLIDMSKDKIPDYLDDEDYLAILSMGKRRLSHTNVQKISYILSNVTELKGKFTAHDYGNFSESIMEKIQSPLNRNIFSVKNDTYFLTSKGTEIYDKAVANLGIKQSVLNLLEILRKMNAEKLEMLTYHMFPEMAKKSRIRPKIEILMSQLKSNSKMHAVRDGDTVTLTVE